MTWLDRVLPAWTAPNDRTYLLVGVILIVLSRVLVIALTPRMADLADLRIYQSAGQAVLAGVNPYDFADQPNVREELRLAVAATDGEGSFAATSDSWNYYVSGNLPVSTASYAAFEYLSQGSRTVWRLLFIIGDVAMFLAMLSLFRVVRGAPLDAACRIAAVCLVVINPSLILSGTVIPEDKQFQTAFMLWAAALLLSPAPTGFVRGMAGGFIVSLSVLCKFFGAFLLPIWLNRAFKEPAKFAVSTVVGALIPIAASFLAFGTHFLLTMSGRAVRDSVEGPEHASPWVLFPWLTGHWYFTVKVLAVVAVCAFLAALTWRRRIDLLNCCAGLTVTFACVWLDKGAMNRMDIAIIFAVAATASLGPTLLVALSAITLLAAVAGYAVGLGLLHAALQQVDAVLVLLFLFAYVIGLSLQSPLRVARA